MDKLLKIEGMEKNIQDSFGLTPVMTAAVVGDLDTIKKLEEMGCDMNYTTSEGQSITDIALNNEHNDVRHLLAKRYKKGMWYF